MRFFVEGCFFMCYYKKKGYKENSNENFKGSQKIEYNINNYKYAFFRGGIY